MELQKQLAGVDKFFEDIEFRLGFAGAYTDNDKRDNSYITFANAIKDEGKEAQEFDLDIMANAIKSHCGDRKVIIVRPGYEDGPQLMEVSEEGKVIGDLRLAFE